MLSEISNQSLLDWFTEFTYSISYITTSSVIGVKSKHYISFSKHIALIKKSCDDGMMLNQFHILYLPFLLLCHEYDLAMFSLSCLYLFIFTYFLSPPLLHIILASSPAILKPVDQHNIYFSVYVCSDSRLFLDNVHI